MRIIAFLALIIFLAPVVASAEIILDEDEYREIQRLQSRIQRYVPKNVKLPTAKAAKEDGTTTVGITVGSVKHRFIITEVQPLSAAEKAGARVGDEIVEIDGKRLFRTMDVPTVAMKISNKGSSAPATIKVGRTAGGYRTLTISRSDKTIVPEVSVERRGDASYVRVVRFGDEMKTRVVEVLGEAARSSTGGIIVDLRNTEGGSIGAAGAFVSAFVKKGTLYATVTERNGSKKLFTTQEPSVKGAVPVVVIVNGRTAVPAEVALAALLEYGRVRIVGEKTRGKGTMILQDGETYDPLKRQVLSPNDRVLTSVGIEPHYIVKEKNDTDAPLALAIKVLHAPDGELDY